MNDIIFDFHELINQYMHYLAVRRRPNNRNYFLGDPAVSCNRHVGCAPQRTCLLCGTANMSAVRHSRHPCCVTQQTCLLYDTAGMSAVSRSRHVCCVTQPTCLCDTTDMSAVRHRTHLCCVTQQTCLLCCPTDMSAVSRSRHIGCTKTDGENMAYRCFGSEKSSSRGVRKITTGITGLW